MLTTNKGEILILKFSVGSFPFKGTKMEKTTQDLPKKKICYFQVTWVLTPWQDAASLFSVLAPS